MADRATASIEQFSLAGPPPVAGFTVRHPRMPDDVHAINAIANATRAAEGDNFYTTDEQFALFYADPPGSDAARDVAIAEVDGRIVGYGRVAVHDQSDGRIYEILPFNEQTADGDAIFMALVGALEMRARAIAADHPAGEKFLQTVGGDKASGREAPLRAIAYEPVRHGYAMVRPSVDDLPDAPLPAGLEIREVLPAHMPAIWAAAEEAFRDAWGFRPSTEGEYQVFLNDRVTSDTTLWRVAWDGDEVAGQVRSYINAEENGQYGRLRGYTESISVRRPWRRRGLARALIAASFPLLRARGMTEAALSVDTENVSGALHVYEGCGFVPVSRTTTYRKPLV